MGGVASLIVGWLILGALDLFVILGLSVQAFVGIPMVPVKVENTLPSRSKESLSSSACSNTLAGLGPGKPLLKPLLPPINDSDVTVTMQEILNFKPSNDQSRSLAEFEAAVALKTDNMLGKSTDCMVLGLTPDACGTAVFLGGQLHELGIHNSYWKSIDRRCSEFR